MPRQARTAVLPCDIADGTVIDVRGENLLLLSLKRRLSQRMNMSRATNAPMKINIPIR